MAEKGSVFFGVSETAEKSVRIIQHENSLTHLETDCKALYAVCVGKIYDEIIKHFLETKTTGKEGCQKPKPATNP